MEKNKNENILKDVGTAIGIGLIAGFAGTIAMTISQKIEMKITGRESSDTPAKVARELFDIKPVTEGKTKKVANEVHWVYGTDMGIVRGALSFLGVTGCAATAVHFATLWGTGMIMLPALRVAPPITKQKPKQIAIDGMHHLIYAVAAGLVFDAINKEKPKSEY